MKIIAFAIALLLVAPAAWAADDMPGKAIFEARCTELCHQTPNAGHLNAKQWRVVLKTMQKRMQGVGMTPLSEEELEQVYQYIMASKP